MQVSPALVQSGESGADDRSSAVLRVGVNPLFWPFSFMDDQGNRGGIDLDIAQLLASSMDMAMEIVVPDKFDDLIPMLKGGEIDVIVAAMSRTYQRSRQVAFTQPYFRTGITTLLNRKTGYEIGIGEALSYAGMMETLKFLKNESKLRVAVVEGKSPAQSAAVFFPKATIVGYPSNEAAAEALLSGETHIMVHDEIFIKSWFNKNKTRALFRLTVFETPYKPDTYGFAVAKGRIDLLHELNVFIEDKLHNEGALQRFMKKHGFRP